MKHIRKCVTEVGIVTRLWVGRTRNHGSISGRNNLHTYMHIYIYIYVYTHTHTHTHIYIYIYLCVAY